uniref:Uncharacterized protein n=1 Tax=Globodera rostochiensis TaxID=31243 RepID=A0A914H262_GLORO
MLTNFDRLNIESAAHFTQLNCVLSHKISSSNRHSLLSPGGFPHADMHFICVFGLPCKRKSAKTALQAEPCRASIDLPHPLHPNSKTRTAHSLYLY